MSTMGAGARQSKERGHHETVSHEVDCSPTVFVRKGCSGVGAAAGGGALVCEERFFRPVRSGVPG